MESLLARLEALEQANRHPPPFWRNTAAVGVLGGVIAIVPASLTAIHEYYQTEREVRLNTTRYEHERTVSYLDRALSPETTEFKQLQVLRFLSTLPSEKDQPIAQWAKAEIEQVTQTVEQLEQVSADAKKTLASLETKKDVLEAETEQILVAAGSKSVEQVEPLLVAKQHQLEQTQKEIEKVEQKAQAAAIRTGKVIEPVVTPEPEPGPAPPVLGRSWGIQIATRRDEAEIRRLAALVSGRGVTPTIYRRNSTYHLMVGRYGTREDAESHVAQARRYVGEGALLRNLDSFCRVTKSSDGLVRCAER